jgi:hypothetical protein
VSENRPPKSPDFAPPRTTTAILRNARDFMGAQGDAPNAQKRGGVGNAQGDAPKKIDMVCGCMYIGLYSALILLLLYAVTGLM